jgi:hypothetical protein
MMMTLIWDVNGKTCIWMNVTTINNNQLGLKNHGISFLVKCGDAFRLYA